MGNLSVAAEQAQNSEYIFLDISIDAMDTAAQEMLSFNGDWIHSGYR
jgi:hypothetical protein